MSKILITLLLLGGLLFSQTAQGARKHVSKTIHLGPCDITVNGDIIYTIFPPAITGFSGTITFGPGCIGSITGNFGFGMVINHNTSGDITGIDFSVEDCDACNSYLETECLDLFIEWLTEEEANL